MRPKHCFLLACIAITCASLVAVILPVSPILRTLTALPLVFVLPGAAVLRALDLRFVPCAHAPIVVGISMGITVLSGLVLDWLGGLTPFGWAAWLGGISVLAAVVARRGIAPDRPPLPSVTVRHGVILAATCAVLLLTVLGTLRDTETYRPFHYTSFWMLPQGAGINAYLIGIKNGEGRPETYAVRLIIDQRIVREWRNLILAPGQSVTYPVTVPPGAPAEAWLFRAEQPDAIYRKVTVIGTEAMGAVAASDLGDEIWR